MPRGEVRWWLRCHSKDKHVGIGRLSGRIVGIAQDKVTEFPTAVEIGLERPVEPGVGNQCRPGMVCSQLVSPESGGVGPKYRSTEPSSLTARSGFLDPQSPRCCGLSISQRVATSYTVTFQKSFAGGSAGTLSV